MSQTSSTDASESSEVHLQNRPPSPPTSRSENQRSQSGDYMDKSDVFRVASDFQSFIHCCKNNAKAFALRFTQLVRRPTGLTPLIFEICWLPLSLFLPGSQSGVDFVYPLSSLTKRRSGHLGRLILDHSKSSRQRNIHEATAVEQGFDPPSTVVIDLNEVPRDVIERGYSVPADIHGLIIMSIILDALIAVYQNIFFPIKLRTKNSVILWMRSWVGERLYDADKHFGSLLSSVVVFCGYAILRGNGILTLVRRSGPIASSYAVFLDREFTVILSGSRNVVEAIAESSFTVSHSIPWKNLQQFLQFYRNIFYEGFRAVCSGFFLTLLVGICLLFRPSSLFTASMPLIPVMVISGLWSLSHIRELPLPPGLRPISLCLLFLCVFMPSYAIFVVYEVAIIESESLADFMGDIGWVSVLYGILSTILITSVVSSRDFPIRTTQFLDILGNPPIRKWEFDTLAATATFQCLVLCHNTTRPIKTIDVLAILDIFIPDQTEVWRAWKNRVADRITHEVDISFSPTLPMFSDERQQRLKELLDQAQVGYRAYRSFYDRHVPLYSTTVT